MAQAHQLPTVGAARILGGIAAAALLAGLSLGSGIASAKQDTGVVVEPTELTFRVPPDGREKSVIVTNHTGSSVEIDVEVETNQEDFDTTAFDVDASSCVDDLEPEGACSIDVTFIAEDQGSYLTRMLVTYSGSETEGNLTIGMLGFISPPTDTTVPSSSTDVVTTSSTLGPPPTTEPVVTTPPATTQPPDTTTQPPLQTTIPVDTSVPSTTGPPGGPTAQEIAECDAKAKHAQFHLPLNQTMTLGETSDVSVSASIGTTAPVSSSPTTSAVPSTSIVELELRCEVWARLAGISFTIEPEGFQARSFLDSPTIEWTWLVEPLEEGNHDMDLTLQAQVQQGPPGQTIQHSFTIEVVVEQPPWWKRLTNGIGDLVGWSVQSAAGIVALTGLVTGGWRLATGHWPWKRKPSPSDDADSNDPEVFE